jgi:hypothetical protein
MDVVLLTSDELLYQEVPGYMNIGRYTVADYTRFRSDPSVDQIYSNRNIGIYQAAN